MDEGDATAPLWVSPAEQQAKATAEAQDVVVYAGVEGQPVTVPITPAAP